MVLNVRLILIIVNDISSYLWLRARTSPTRMAAMDWRPKAILVARAGFIAPEGDSLDGSLFSSANTVYPAKKTRSISWYVKTRGKVRSMAWSWRLLLTLAFFLFSPCGANRRQTLFLQSNICKPNICKDWFLQPCGSSAAPALQARSLRIKIPGWMQIR